MTTSKYDPNIITPFEKEKVLEKAKEIFETIGVKNRENCIYYDTVTKRSSEPGQIFYLAAGDERFTKILKSKMTRDKLLDIPEAFNQRNGIFILTYQVTELYLETNMEVKKEKQTLIDKINKCLSLADDKSNEHEAALAAKMAQDLLAKHDLSMVDLVSDDLPEVPVECSIDMEAGKNWKVSLAHIVAENYRCKCWGIGDNGITFYGFKDDAYVARKVFSELFTIGNKLASKKYEEVLKENGTGRGVYNSFCIGFMTGVEEVLHKNCVALALTIPKEVEDAFEEKIKDFKTSSSRIRQSGFNTGAYQEGISEGKAAMRGGYLKE